MIGSCLRRTSQIEQELKSVGDWHSELIFMTHSLPVSRGIFASIYAETKSEISAAEARASVGG